MVVSLGILLNMANTTQPTKKKRTRRSAPLYIDISLYDLQELLEHDDEAKVKVSRIFALELQKQALEKEAKLKLGI